MRIRATFVSVAVAGLTVGPAFAQGVISSVAGAKAECTITGTAADDNLNGTARDDVICLKAGSDEADGLEGNDIIRGGQGDDGGGAPPNIDCFGTRSHPRGVCDGVVIFVDGIAFKGLRGGDGSDTVKGQADDDSVEGYDQNDKLYGGQGADCLGANCTQNSPTPDSEHGNDFLKSRDRVSGNDYVDGGDNTDTCVIDAGDENHSCEL